VDEEARQRRDSHQYHPDFPEQTVKPRAFGVDQNVGAQNGGWNNRGHMELHGQGSTEKRLYVH
jgi:hypothetical protein